MAFEAGVIVFFRTLDQTNNLARSVHPTGRDIAIRARDAHPEDYVVLDAHGKTLGIYPRDWVSCILPLDTTGPAANASDQPPRRDSASSAEAGDPPRLPRRVKGVNS